MDVFSANLPSPAAALGFVWSSLLSACQSYGETATRAVKSLTVTADCPTPAILDGESAMLGDRFRIEFVQDAARCLVAG